METQRIELDPATEMTQGFLMPIGRQGESLAVREVLVIGRDGSCQMVTNDPFVSSKHARIERRGGSYILRDLQSRNGTYLNGSRVSEAILSPHDQIRLGESTFLFLESKPGVAPLSSKNKPWNTQLQLLSAFAATDFPVLINGPSGSGKDILARAIHETSARKAQNFVSINCSALSDGLIESELFGHVRGSFTGATHDRKGAFETARGGTLFLDEIGDLPLSLQPKLLRAIENNEIRPVGSDRVVQTDVRILAATHKDLVEQVSAAKFREDLFYRLNVCQISPPALNQRMEDFNDLVYQLAKHYRVRFSFGAIERLRKHSWPGNIRELKNAVARASAYYPGKHIQPDDIESLLGARTPSAEPPPGPRPAKVIQADSTELPVGNHGNIIKEIEKEMIIRRLAANRGNQRRTAQELGIPKSTLHDRIKAYSIDVKAIEGAIEGAAD